MIRILRRVALPILLLTFFFFKQKTAYEIGTGDWSSDVCSSDLPSSPALSLFSHSKPVVSALTLTSLVINATAVSPSPPLHMLPSTYPTLLLFLVLD